MIGGGINETENAPGGGFMLTVEDPEGFPVDFIHGQSSLDQKQIEKASKARPDLLLNYGIEKNRKRAFQRFETGPAQKLIITLFA